MEAAGTGAWATSGLAVLAALLVSAAPASAQDALPVPEATPSPEEAIALVEQVVEAAEVAPPVPGDAALPPGDQEEEAAAGDGGPVAPGAEAEGHADPGARLAPPPAEELVATTAPAPRTLSARPPGEPSPGSPAVPETDERPPAAETPSFPPPEPAPPAAEPDPQPLIEPEVQAPPVAPAEKLRPLLRRVEARLRAVEEGVGRVHRRLDAGREPAPRALRELRTDLERLRVALTELERVSARADAPPAGGFASVLARLDRLRDAAADLAAGLSRRAAPTPELNALVAELLGLGGGRAVDAPATAHGRRPAPTGAARRPVAVGSPGAAYTQPYAPPARSQSGSGPSATRPRARAAHPPTPRRQLPTAPRGPADSAASVASFSNFSFAGPSALALLVGLALPRIVWRLARLPACRPPVWVASPPERPG